MTGCFCLRSHVLVFRRSQGGEAAKSGPGGRPDSVTSELCVPQQAGLFSGDLGFQSSSQCTAELSELTEISHKNPVPTLAQPPWISASPQRGHLLANLH